jgi:hypothetical protein
MPFVTAIESSVDCLLHNDSVFDIVLLLFVIVMAWSWVLRERLSSVRSSSLMLPELTSLCFRQERLRLLSDELTVRCRSQLLIGLLLNRNNGFVSAWIWGYLHFGRLLAIRHLRLENSVFTTSIEKLSSLHFVIIDTRTWVAGPAHLVVSHVGLLEDGSLHFALVELVLRMLLADGWLLWIVSGWTNSVSPSSSVGSLS